MSDPVLPDPLDRSADPFRRLVAIMARLRDEGGCPWDREQDHDSLVPYLIEEAYEVKEAIDRREMESLREELGDLLLQIVFHAQLANEAGRFDIDGVLRAICEKLIGRHPHVFGDVKADSPEQVLQNWEQIKLDEKREREDEPSRLSGVPKHLPALLRAQRVQEKAARVGFDWEHVRDVFAKVREEIAELEAAAERGETAQIGAEMGDLLFALVNLSRFLNVHSELTLHETIERFIERFRHIERQAAAQGRSLEEMTLAEMDALWNEAKQDKGGKE
ncbi:pyrophosphatase [candidate division BRC1 bacterium SM23_51]|nr:MAG: pyrophosphatase [candidate division BRC1 bacterium SM23_51]